MQVNNLIQKRRRIKRGFSQGRGRRCGYGAAQDRMFGISLAFGKVRVFPEAACRVLRMARITLDCPSKMLNTGRFLHGLTDPLRRYANHAMPATAARPIIRNLALSRLSTTRFHSSPRK